MDGLIQDRDWLPVSIEPDRPVRAIIDHKPIRFAKRGDPCRKAIEPLPVRDEHARLHLRLQRAHRVSSVAKSLSATSTSLPVSARMSGDFPAFVYPTSATRS